MVKQTKEELYVYISFKDMIVKLPMSLWRRSQETGTITFSPKSNQRFFRFEFGMIKGELFQGLNWQQMYCLFHLGIDFARIEGDSFVWNLDKVEQENLGVGKSISVPIHYAKFAKPESR
jgi:hypothetical protein